MAALAADYPVTCLGDGEVLIVPGVASDIFYAGAVIYALAAGYASPAPVAGSRPLGICTTQVTTSSVAGDPVEIYVGGLFQFASTVIDGSDIGDLVVLDATNVATVLDSISLFTATARITVAANDAILGRCVSYLNSMPVVQLGGLTGLIYIGANLSGSIWG